MRPLLDFLRTDDVPVLSRPALRLERVHMLLWGLFAGVVEGNTSSIVVSKTFGASELLVSVVYATPMVANVLALVWGAVLRGRPRRPLFVGLSLAAALSFASVALVPADLHPWGGWLFALQVGLARVFLAGLINVRISMWSANYPALLRARITGRLQSIRFVAAMIAVGAAGVLFDRDADAYRWFYPLAGLVSVASLGPLKRVRVRGERRELARFRSERVHSTGAGAGGMGAALRESLLILRRDRGFARYCTAQYLLGSAAFMQEPVLVLVLTQRLHLGYVVPIVLMDVVPRIVQVLTLPLWSRYFDRVEVRRFRVVNSAVWLAACLCAMGGLAALAGPDRLALPLAAALLVASRVLNGAGSGGGAVAWNLGHLQFAARHNADLYMGIHVALTGLRGMIMPFVGAIAYTHFGWGALLIACALAALALRLFRRLAREHAAANASG